MIGEPGPDLNQLKAEPASMGSFQSDQFPVLVCHMVALCFCLHGTGARDFLTLRDGLSLPLKTMICKCF